MSDAVDAGMTFRPTELGGLPARYAAQKITFAAVALQCGRIAWQSGLLAMVDSAVAAGAVAPYFLINTCPYFAAIASGNSRMYQFDESVTGVRDRGLQLAKVVDDPGIRHSLPRFERFEE